MSNNASQQAGTAFAEESDGASEVDFKPLTAEQARLWRVANPVVSPWRIVRLQLLVGVALALSGWFLTGLSHVGWSVAYGALAVVIPAALFVRGLVSRPGVAGAALTRFFVWELAKIALTVAMLLAAPELVPELSWLALVAGFVVTMKVYWVAVWLHPGRRRRAG